MIDRSAQAGTPDVPARRLRPGEHEDRARAREQKGTWLRLVSQCHATRFSRNVCGHVQQRARVSTTV